MSPNAILIVGLGNPGPDYAGTRHNVGFLVVDRLAQSLSSKWSQDRAARADVAETNVDGTKVILAKPQTFMNLSGESVASLRGRFHIPACNIWVVYDDAALPFGILRIRLEGSAGGHNGVKSIIASLGSEDFIRLRVGIGEATPPIMLEDFVLQKFAGEEAKLLPGVIEKVSDKIRGAIGSGLTGLTENLA